MAELTDAEQAFFATGELPAELAAQHAASVAAPLEPESIAPIVEPAVAPPAVPDAAEMLRRSLAEEQNRRSVAEFQLQQIRAELEAKLHPPTPAPDASTDPLGAMMHQLNQVNASVADLQNKLATEQQNATLKQQFTEFTNSVRAIKDAYEKIVPDFNDAYQHVRGLRAQDLRMTGMQEAQINQTLLQDELNIAQTALTTGKNPAEEMYNMAKRYGYVPKQAAAGGTAAAAQAKIDAILKGQAAGKQPASGSPPPADITVDALKDMSSNDLTKLVMDDKTWDKIVGGKSQDIF